MLSMPPFRELCRKIESPHWVYVVLRDRARVREVTKVLTDIAAHVAVTQRQVCICFFLFSLLVL